MLTPKAITEFQSLYLKEYGEALSPEEATLLGENLIQLYKALLKPSADEQQVPVA